MCNKNNKFKKLQQQFLCCYPINQVDWTSLNLPLDWEAQQQLLSATCAHPLNLRFPVRRKYQETFIKHLLELLKNHEELHDDIYNHLCQPLSASVDNKQTYAYKHYIMPEPYNCSITLRESNCFVSEGTTGLCTWEAALALSDYLLKHASIVQGKNILELGAGAGLCGIMLKLCPLQVSSVLLTDGSEACLQLLRQNIDLNFNAASFNATPPECALLDWQHVHNFQWSDYKIPNLLLAADIIYDDTQFPALINALNFIYKMCNNSIEMLLASTVRNAETLEKFMQLLAKHQYQILPCNNVPASSSHFCRNADADVRIVCIKR